MPFVNAFLVEVHAGPSPEPHLQTNLPLRPPVVVVDEEHSAVGVHLQIRMDERR